MAVKKSTAAKSSAKAAPKAKAAHEGGPQGQGRDPGQGRHQGGAQGPQGRRCQEGRPQEGPGDQADRPPEEGPGRGRGQEGRGPARLEGQRQATRGPAEKKLIKKGKKEGEFFRYFITKTGEKQATAAAAAPVGRGFLVPRFLSEPGSSPSP